VRARLRKDAAALATAVEVGDAILERGEREGEAMFWPDKQVEIIYGAAGTLLFLLELGEETKEQRFLDAARAAGRWLVTQGEAKPSRAQPERKVRSWSWAMGGGHLPNFSHGTAGIAYALLRVAAATGDEACAEAGREGAAWLTEHAIRDGALARWPAREGSDTSMGGWCHGPPGTARLFLLLHRTTGEKEHLDVALASARWVMAQAPAPAAGGNATAPSFPPSFCCGVAGVLDFFCDLYRATSDEEFAAFAARAGDYLLDVAKADGDGLKWQTGASAHPGSAARYGIDLMLGTAGEALALLRLATLHQPIDPIEHLPDRSVGQ
jgi:lantibiotic modifying enzyme